LDASLRAMVMTEIRPTRSADPTPDPRIAARRLDALVAAASWWRLEARVADALKRPDPPTARPR
jgi:hypothetical protein